MHLLLPPVAAWGMRYSEPDLLLNHKVDTSAGQGIPCGENARNHQDQSTYAAVHNNLGFKRLDNLIKIQNLTIFQNVLRHADLYSSEDISGLSR